MLDVFMFSVSHNFKGYFSEARIRASLKFLNVTYFL